MISRGLSAKFGVLVLAALIWVPYVLSSLLSSFSGGFQIQEEGIFAWVVLLCCSFWLVVNRQRIASDLRRSGSFFAGPSHLLAGLLACVISLATAVAMAERDILTAIVPASLFVAGVSSVLGTFIPLVLCVIYGVGVYLPAFIGAFAEVPYSQPSVGILVSVLRLLGYSAAAEGTKVVMLAGSTEVVSFYVNSMCAGSSSLSVFICLFALVTLDLGLRPGKEVGAFFVAGCLGAFAQAVLRLVVVSLAGFYFGQDLLLLAHTYAGYVIFAAYFAVFCYFYLRWARGSVIQLRKVET